MEMLSCTVEPLGGVSSCPKGCRLNMVVVVVLRVVEVEVVVGSDVVTGSEVVVK